MSKAKAKGQRDMFGHKKFRPEIIKGKVLDIGCGSSPLKGAVALDYRPLPNIDIVADLNKPLPIENETFDVVYANQVLEHIHNLVPLMEEIHRILRPGGKLVAHVPYFRSSWAHVDPTHCRSFTINTMDYFVQGKLFRKQTPYTERAFSDLEVFIDTDYPSYPWRGLLTRLALFRPWRCENGPFSFLFTFEQLTFVLTK